MIEHSSGSFLLFWQAIETIPIENLMIAIITASGLAQFVYMFFERKVLTFCAFIFLCACGVAWLDYKRWITVDEVKERILPSLKNSGYLTIMALSAATHLPEDELYSSIPLIALKYPEIQSQRLPSNNPNLVDEVWCYQPNIGIPDPCL